MSRVRRNETPASARPRLQPRSALIAYTAAAFLALLGIADALYLTVLHLTGQSALCGEGMSCSQVLASAYSHIGPVPIAGLGLLGYFAVFSSAVFAAFRYIGARRWFTLSVGAMFLGTLWLLYVQAFLLHQYCRYCLFSAALAFLLTGIVVALPTSPRA